MTAGASGYAGGVQHHQDGGPGPSVRAPDAADAAVRRCVGDVDEFARDYWGRRPLLVRSGGSFDDLIDVAAVESLLVHLGRRPSFRVVKAGTTIPVAHYTKRSRVGGVEIDDVADVDRVLDLVAGGATIVLQGLQRTWPPLERFCRELEQSASHPVQANAYLSPPTSAGLNPHADPHDVIILQVAGTKQWDVDGLGRHELRAGDSMYVPAGARHSATTTAEHSLHLTIGILSTTRRQAIHRIIDRLDAELDAPLPFGYARAGKLAELTADLATAVKSTAHHLADVQAADEAARQVGRHRRRRRTSSSRLAVAVDPDAIHDAVVVRRVDGALVGLSTDESGWLQLELSDRRLRFPTAAAEALDVVASRESFAVGQLTGLDQPSRAVLARRLIREGLLERADDVPLS